MGVPALFRWLTNKYPKITSPVIQEEPGEIDGFVIPVDISKPNPNGEFHCLYLDMNGIIHPCTHPLDRPAPKTEEEMFVAIFDYIDNIMAMIRPRKVLYMAIDGVAPRAKMNQQRSRRFRAAQEAFEASEAEDKIREDLTSKGRNLPDKSEKFDSNCITPGTPFMHRLGNALRFYIAKRINSTSGWEKLQIILSDASVPGEGEHKIMDFIRHQRLSPNYDVNMRHCLYGLDADLIMLGLATHEPDFHLLREDVLVQQGNASGCSICGQRGHIASKCMGLSADQAILPPSVPDKMVKPFVFLHINVLREYLQFELKHDMIDETLATGATVSDNAGRAIDDWVFLCFFVGNDFLPHLPSLEIREGAINELVRIYKRLLPVMGEFLTDSGNVNMEFLQRILQELGFKEDFVFKRRQKNELDYQNRLKNLAEAKKETAALLNAAPSVKPVKPADAYRDLGKTAESVTKPSNSNNIPSRWSKVSSEFEKNLSAADKMRAEMFKEMNGGIEVKDVVQQEPSKNDMIDLTAEHEKKPRVVVAPTAKIPDLEPKEGEDEEEDDPETDEVRLWEDGWKERYYASKFKIPLSDKAFIKKLVKSYVEGLCWVLRYYYQGCASWKWYYPYHYAPFASDFEQLDLKIEATTKFDIGAPLRPLEQLMAVLPPASRKHIPEKFRGFMTDPDSSIIDFYPEKFEIDLNGKKHAWQGVVILPFIDEDRLLRAMRERYMLMNEDEALLNKEGNDLIFVGSWHGLYKMINESMDIKANEKVRIDRNVINAQEFIDGFISPFKSNPFVPNATIPSIVSRWKDITGNVAACAIYFNLAPPDGFRGFKAVRLPGAQNPVQIVEYTDFIDSYKSKRDSVTYIAKIRSNNQEPEDGPQKQKRKSMEQHMHKESFRNSRPYVSASSRDYQNKKRRDNYESDRYNPPRDSYKADYHRQEYGGYRMNEGSAPSHSRYNNERRDYDAASDYGRYNTQSNATRPAFNPNQDPLYEPPMPAGRNYQGYGAQNSNYMPPLVPQHSYQNHYPPYGAGNFFNPGPPQPSFYQNQYRPYASSYDTQNPPVRQPAAPSYESFFDSSRTQKEHESEGDNRDNDKDSEWSKGIKSKGKKPAPPPFQKWT